VMVLLVVVFVCVFPSCLRVLQCASTTHRYLLDLFEKWGFKGVPVIFVNCLGNCFVRFVSDYGCRSVLYPLFVSVLPYDF
jgi:hypothetical protein